MPEMSSSAPKIQLGASPEGSTAETQAPQMPEQDDAVNRLYQDNSNNTAEAAGAAPGAPGEDVVMNNSPKKKSKFKPKLWQKIVLGVLIFLLVLASPAIVLGFYTVKVVAQIKSQSDDIQTSARNAYDQFKGQNLPGSESELKNVAEKLKRLRITYQQLWMYNYIPVAHAYYQDGLHGLNAADAGVSAGLKAVEAVAPYADVLGFKGAGTFAGGTAEDRLKLILQTIEKVKPQLDSIEGDLAVVKTEMSGIDPQRYPENFQGKPLRSYVQKSRDYSVGASSAITEFRPVIERLSYAAGVDKRRKYFVIFQNDNELRPTGGFLTAYAVVFVENGKVSLEKSDDIYALDKKFSQKIPIPEKLGKYLTTEKQWNMRDMNIYPDLKQSMDTFVQYYKTIKDEPKDIDGIVVVDTHVLTDLLKILGPVNVPGYGTFSDANDPKCNCPQIIHALSEIITRPTPYIRQDRKGILGPMMRSILDKAYTAPKNSWPDMFATAWSNVQGRHVQFYFFDAETQKAAETVGAAGRMTHDPTQDFFAIVDANLGGAKSNLYVKYNVDQQVSAPNGTEINKKVTVTYKNDHAADNCNLEAGLLCLNATLRDWFRVYLPKGSKMVNTQGFKAGTVKEYDEGEFTVIDGEFNLQPMSQAKIQLEYTVPYTNKTDYKMKVWKQGGIDSYTLNMDVNGDQQTVNIDKDTLYQAKF
jgi:hypothetical protein